MEALAIAPDTHVTLTYVLFDAKGEAVDKATAEEPLEYVHGYAEIVPGLERQIVGLKAGEKGVFEIEPAEAFGEPEKEAIFAVDKSDFEGAGDVKVGDEFMAEGPDGDRMPMRVIEIQEDAFVVDMNHPLAGQKVRFEVSVIAVRPATEEEITEAQADLEDRAEDADDGCGCGHDHSHDGHDHEHGHDHDHGHAHEHGAPELIQLSKKSTN